MENQSMIMENFSVIFVFILFQLSFRASLEVCKLYVSFKQFFFLTGFFIFTVGCHNLSMRDNIVISQKFYQRDSKLKVAGSYSICHSVFLTIFLISSLGCHSQIHCYLSIIFPTRLNVESEWFVLHLS